MNAERDIIEALKRKQEELGEIDDDFADRLGIERSTWQKIRTGVTTSPSKETLQGAGAAFPDLAPLLLALFLGRKERNRTRRERNRTTTEPVSL